MSKFIRRLKCWLGHHELIISQEEQALLDEAMKNPLAQVLRLNRLSDGTEIVFKVCVHCGSKR